MKTRNILLVVEGRVTEVEFFSRFGELFFDNKTKLVFYPYSSNVYSLYHRLKNYEDMTDTIAVLKEMATTEEQKNLLKRKFAEIYLIFDYDPQETAYSDEKIRAMLSLFDNETELGKIYINYPMMESFRDHRNFSTQDYLKRSISIKDISSEQYKLYVRDIGWNKNIAQITERHFKMLCRMNIIKSNFILYSQNKMPEQINCSLCTNQEQILNKEIELKNEEDTVTVLNTCTFFLLDYFGDKYYRDIANAKK